MNRTEAKVNAIVETLKEFVRWALSFFIGWLLENGYYFFAKSKLSPDILLAIGIAFRAADFYWHKYNKEVQPDTTGKSMGLFGF